MSIFGDLKKIFFGAKSVAKHQAEKAGEFAKEVGSELQEQGSELAEKAKHQLKDLADKGESLAEKAMDKLENLGEDLGKNLDTARGKASVLAEDAQDSLADAGDFLAKKTHSAKDLINDRLGSLNTHAKPAPASAQDLADTAKEAVSERLDLNELESDPRKALDFEADLPAASSEPSALREAADQALDKAAAAGLGAKAAAEKLGGKLMDVSEKVGEKVLEKGSDALDKAAELGAGLKEKADALVEKASAAAEKESLDEAIEKAKEAADLAEARARAFGNKEGERDASGSLLDGTDSFFDRAAKFADGDYHREGSIKITKEEAEKKAKANDKISGFDDLDGDGDALIDDAEISE